MHLGIRQPKLCIKGKVSQHLHQASHETFPSDAHVKIMVHKVQPVNSSGEWANASTAHGTSEALLVCGRSIGGPIAPAGSLLLAQVSIPSPPVIH